MIASSTQAPSMPMRDLQARRAGTGKPALTAQSGAAAGSTAGSNAGPAVESSRAAATAGTEPVGAVLETKQDDLRPALPPLADEAAATEATQSIRQRFLAQPGIALLTQANLAPQNVERLLQ